MLTLLWKHHQNLCGSIQQKFITCLQNQLESEETQLHIVTQGLWLTDLSILKLHHLTLLVSFTTAAGRETAMGLHTSSTMLHLESDPQTSVHNPLSQSSHMVLGEQDYQ